MTTENINTKYSDLSSEQKLALTEDGLDLAAKLEALDRGIKIPISLGDQLETYEFKGWTMPQESLTLYELITTDEYNSIGSGICFQTEEEAFNALNGAFHIKSTGYGATQKMEMSTGDITVRRAFLRRSDQESFGAKLEIENRDLGPWRDMLEELTEDLSGIRQADYNKRVNTVKKAEYLKLANGEESVAKAFWNKSETVQWPEDEAVEAAV